jgi:hypothetical protein
VIFRSAFRPELGSEGRSTQSFISFSISLRQIPECRARMEADRKGSAAREIHCLYSAALKTESVSRSAPSSFVYCSTVGTFGIN